jgi:ABC-2 type transport system ATP-binding protein
MAHRGCGPDHLGMIEVDHVTKRYGEKVAVDDLTFSVRPGIVTGFLGPNGAGKSTTMRVILGLDAPSSGEARIDGVRYRDFPAPLHKVGALLEARAIHTGRSAYNHLLAMAQTHGIPRPRVDEVIDLVGLRTVARKRAGGFSLGMGQRLGVAAALLGDPEVLILDEPANGLDPEGILWIRNLLKGLAADGRTVFLSSHLMSEIAVTAEHLVVIGRGRLIADTSVAEIVAEASKGAAVLVRTPDAAALREALRHILANAMEAMPTGGRLLIETRASDASVSILISDTGVGMSPAVRLRAVEPFFTTKGLKVTGLGLSVAYGIVRSHGGDIAIRSAQGSGTTVIVTLPREGTSSGAAS